MREAEEKAERDQGELFQYLNRAIALAEELMGEGITLSDSDHLGFVALGFLCKQIEQSGSVLVLVENGKGRDAQLIARSCLETLTSLLWIAQEPEDRALQWRCFACVEDWRLMRRLRETGEEPDPEDRKAIDESLSQYGHILEDPRKDQTNDPYYSNWRCGTTIRRIFDVVEGQLLYREAYGTFSDWIHAGPKAIGLAIHRKDKTIQWLPAAASVTAMGIAVAFLCIVQTCQFVDRHFQLGYGKRLQELVTSYGKRFASDLG